MVKNTIFGLVVLIAVVALIFAVGPAALADGAESNAIDDESITVDYDQPTPVVEDGVEYDETVTIVVDGSTLSAGTDYDWYATNGTVTWHNTSATLDGAGGTISYTVHQVSETSRGIAELIAVLGISLGLAAVWIVGEIAISGRF